MRQTANNYLRFISQRAHKDPVFFHALVFDPQKVIEDLKDAESLVKTVILHNDPFKVINVITGQQSAVRLINQIVKDCNGTCVCTCSCPTCAGNTCNGNSCNVTSNIFDAANEMK